jgi:hypothetical protein
MLLRTLLTAHLMFTLNRSASLIISLLGAIFNFTFAVHVLAAWRSIKSESDSEWEGAPDSWRVDGVKLVWGLLSAYFVAATSACLVGFAGIINVRLAPFFLLFSSLPIDSNPTPLEPSLINQVLP